MGMSQRYGPRNNREHETSILKEFPEWIPLMASIFPHKRKYDEGRPIIQALSAIHQCS
jgi:hypothetical protein